MVIDFAFAVFDGEAAQLQVPFQAMKTLGDGLNPRPLVWDDAYAAVQVIKMMEQVSGIAFDSTRDALKDRIGRSMFSLEVIGEPH
jgi:hypothetical protein